ncbi:Bug family tripartite tricarboxylate transporter substrate binding protein [Roseomonas xinghualingensis]|uniref:Bug family tripartite tricarboxylate transporter substrate binding protein n=1 Tax=Roseomonas xinghualingensis TaxID=2986475 RepID=UPI0021F0CAF8|nr:tripartite tricarboxylate transporter substrate binding protein [Roseomonas sp. SXEYE001]MCV4208248.1 tripartite tricarboxylate transporter substrate binding protein [Roseomonas sp. SXEYE001]
MLTRRTLGMAALGLPLISLARVRDAAAQADPNYPSRPVTLVVPWAAGGSTDAVARILAARLSQDSGKSFVVDNRAGANGTIGFASVARARPDGYTLLVGTISTYAMAPHLYQLPYDNDRAFTGVGLVAAQPMIMVVPKNSPARTLAEFIELAKRPDSNMTYANSGTGSSTHLATELFLQAADLRMNDVGYRAGAQAVQGTLQGEVSMVIQAASGLLPLIQSGELRPLAISSRERSSVAPDIPTFREQGFPDYEAVEHIAILAPAGTPAPIIARVNGMARAAMTAAETRERLAALAVTPEMQGPEEWAAYNAAENAKWREVIRSRDIKVQ